jgi:dTDP-4-dehydrorhamnose 3,5-epimerase-like enzyme
MKRMKLAEARLEEVRWIDLPSNRDERGVLTSVESEQDAPFAIKRIFYMHHVASDRGGHAHMDTDQVVISIAGDFEMELCDGKSSSSYRMNDPTRGLYVPRMLFIKIRGMSAETVCLVLASTHYDMSRSLRNWEDYLQAVGLEGD